MLGFDPLTLSAAYMLASAGVAQCPASPPGTAHVRYFVEDHPAVGVRETDELTSRFINDVNSTMIYHGKWMKGGSTELHLKESIKVEYDTRPAADGKVCLSVSNVTYTITYNPTIYIVADLSPCVGKAARAHEQRHVDADIAVINDYLAVLEKAINEDVATLGTDHDPMGKDGIGSPVAADDVKSVKGRVTEQILKAAENPWQGLPNLIRAKRLADDDNIKVYQEDTAACPGEFPPFAMAH